MITTKSTVDNATILNTIVQASNYVFVYNMDLIPEIRSHV